MLKKFIEFLGNKKVQEEKKFYSVHELDKLGGLSAEQVKEIRGRVPILIIDDEQHEMYKKTLYENGFHGVSSLRVSPVDDEVWKYSIIIVDIRGIRDDLNSDGIIYAERIKKICPLKEVILMSGVESYITQMEGRNLDEVWFFNKGAPLDKLFNKLDESIRNLYDPSLVWRNVRNQLLRRDSESRMDMDISYVAKLEEQFVKSVLGIEPQIQKINVDWVNLIKNGVSLAKEVSSLINCIAPLIVTH